MKLPEEPDMPPQINIVPMIDVIFAILTFFIMSTLFLIRLEGLPVNLPTAVNAVQTEPQAPPVTVSIDAQGNLAIDRQPTDLDRLESQLRQIIAHQTSLTVVINADTLVSHGRVVAVMDRLRGIAGVKIAIATTRPANPS